VDLRPLVLQVVVGAVFSGLVVAVEHWFPWPKPLGRVAAYKFGCAAIWVGFTVARVAVGDWGAPVVLGAVMGASGLVVMAAYQVDRWVLQLHQAERAERHDAALGDDV